MSARQVKAGAADDLLDAGPTGCMAAEYWQLSTPAERANRLLVESGRRVAQAASVLNAGMMGSAEERAAALFFIAGSLQHEARLIERARQVLSVALDQAEKRAKATPSPRPAAPRDRAKPVGRA